MVGFGDLPTTVPDAILLSYYRAAAEFIESQVWLKLRTCRHREFGLQAPGRALPSSFRDCFPVVGLVGLKGAAHLNGSRGEVVKEQGGRMLVRLFEDGKQVSVRPENAVRGDAEQRGLALKILGGDGGPPHLLVYPSWASLFEDSYGPHRPTENPGSRKHTPGAVGVMFLPPNNALGTAKLDVTQLLRLDPALAQRLRALRGMGAPTFPVLYAYSALSKADASKALVMLALALRAAVRFVPSFAKPERRLPRSIPCVHSYDPMQLPLRLDAAGLRGGSSATAAVEVVCSYPSGELAMRHRPSSSMPGLCYNSNSNSTSNPNPKP